ncbi:MAG TPA: hypothetical protein VFF73_01090 [Planctomycetota bacterium]|nr:hypothetical protein [Planctomycetota bacterium]
MRILLLLLGIALSQGCSLVQNYDVTVDVALVGSSATASPGLYKAGEPVASALATAPRLKPDPYYARYAQSGVICRFEYGDTSERATWSEENAWLADGRRRTYLVQRSGSPPRAVTIVVSLPGWKRVERRFECGEDGTVLDITGVLEKDPDR